MNAHAPVMVDTCTRLLEPGPGRWYVDGTFGAGGHSEALLAQGASVLAIDRDPAAAARAAELGSPRLTFREGNYRNMDTIAHEAGVRDVAGVLLDLGVSSMQLDQGERGFAFRHDGPLDMRMGGSGPSAAEVVNDASGDELAAILYRYGDERHSRRIARAIVAERSREAITTTGRLAAVVAAAQPGGRRRDHPARRTFQALRIHVNDELAALAEGLSAAESLLADRGRLVVLSYHSLEDRIVKQYLRERPRLEPMSKRPLLASPEEIDLNPRARSAKLRAAQKVAA